MAILAEDGNEYEVKIVNAVTGQSFEEYVMLGDREKHSEREVERYITAYPGIMFKIQIILKTGFRFKPFDAVEANLYFKGQSTYCGLAVLSDPHPGHDARTKQDLRMEIACVNMSNYGKNIIGAPFVFKELKIDEKLSGQTDIIGVNPIDLGSFYITLNRRRIAAMPNNYLSRGTTTALWNAEKVDKSSFKERGITNSVGLGQNRISTNESVVSSYKFYTSDLLRFKFIYRNFGFLNRSDIVPILQPLYYNHWMSLTGRERWQALRELQKLYRSRRALSPSFTPKHRESEEWRSWDDMQPPEREILFLNLQNELRELERKVDKKQVSDSDRVNLPSEEPLAKIRKTNHKPIEVDTINNVKIEQEPTDFGTLEEKARVLNEEATMKYDLTELIDDVVLLKPSTPTSDSSSEDSVYWEMAEEILRQTVAEFIRTRA
ncbi:hypothetical protein EAE96_010867 [Botrytis aclada]|nr:hypothetical protein EAE96_010867 [Botrytis aclada]